MNTKLIDLSIFNYSLKTAAFRYGVITVLALSNAHLRLGFLPFQKGYFFPTRSVLHGLLFGLIICTSSWVFSNLFKEKMFFDSKIDFKTVIRFLGYNSLVTILVFTLITVIIFGIPIPAKFYYTFLFVALSIIIIENLLFLVYGTLMTNKELTDEVRKIEKKSIIIPTGSKSHCVKIKDIAFIELKNEIVIFHLMNEKTVNSQFDSLEQLEQALPQSVFYRANRQFIVHRNSIKNIQKGLNRKLKVLVTSENQEKEITVSRYKSKDLQNWLSATF